MLSYMCFYAHRVSFFVGHSYKMTISKMFCFLNALLQRRNKVGQGKVGHDAKLLDHMGMLPPAKAYFLWQISCLFLINKSTNKVNIARFIIAPRHRHLTWTFWHPIKNWERSALSTNNIWNLSSGPRRRIFNIMYMAEDGITVEGESISQVASITQLTFQFKSHIPGNQVNSL